MPYKIVKENSGFKVCDAKRCFSNSPITKKQAMKQRVAIALSEHAKTGKPMKSYFI